MRLRTKRHTLMGERVPLVALDVRLHRPPKEAFELPPEPQPIKGWRAVAYGEVARDVVGRIGCNIGACESCWDNPCTCVKTMGDGSSD